jgi:hypothetical protein
MYAISGRTTCAVRCMRDRTRDGVSVTMACDSDEGIPCADDPVSAPDNHQPILVAHGNARKGGSCTKCKHPEPSNVCPIGHISPKLMVAMPCFRQSATKMDWCGVQMKRKSRILVASFILVCFHAKNVSGTHFFWQVPCVLKHEYTHGYHCACDF